MYSTYSKICCLCLCTLNLYFNYVVLCIETFRQSNTGFEEFNNFVLKWDGMLRILKDSSDERSGWNIQMEYVETLITKIISMNIT